MLNMKNILGGILSILMTMTLMTSCVEEPIQEFDGNDSWGYGNHGYFAMDKAYGTRNDYKAFIDACHQRVWLSSLMLCILILQVRILMQQCIGTATRLRQIIHGSISTQPISGAYIKTGITAIRWFETMSRVASPT